MLNGSVAFLDPQVGLPQVLLFVGSPKLVFLRSVDFSKHTIVCTKAYYSMHDDMIRKHIKGGYWAALVPPGDQETWRPGDQETRGPGDQETRRPGDQETRRPLLGGAGRW